MDDQELIRRIQEDDPNGLTFLYRQFKTEFVRWIRRFASCDEDDAQEYFQASVVIFYDNIRTGKVAQLKSSIKTYLFGVGKKLVWQGNRKQARTQKVHAEYYLLEQVRQGVSFEQPEYSEQQLELVSHCFELLGEPCQRLLDLFYYQQKKMEEIASILGYKNPDTAKNQKYKCMERLRKMVEDEKTLSTLT